MGQGNKSRSNFASAGRLCALRLAWLASLTLLASDCGLSQWVHNGFKVGPDYCCPPAAEVAENWIDIDDPRVIPCPPECPDWWSVFQDPVLNELVAAAYQQNLTLREAGLRVLEARAQRAIAAGDGLPQSQTIDGSYTREQIGIVQQPFLAPLPDFKRSFDAWPLSGNLSWELDVWGRFRRAVEAADADLEASVHDYDAILVSLIAEVVTAYADIRTFEKRLDYARQNLRIQEGSAGLAEAKAVEGKTDKKIGAFLSASTVQTTEASVASLVIGLRQANLRLCTLLGVPPVDQRGMIGEDGGIPTAPAEVVVGIPADLLRRRPNVRAAERQVAAQSAQIGIAKSELYHSIAVTGKISVQAEEFNDLFTSLSQGEC